MAPFLFSEDFITYLQVEKRYSEHTTTAYRKDVSQFFEFSGVSIEKELEEVSYKVVRGWLVQLVDDGYTNKSVNRKLSSLRTYFNYLRKRNVLTLNPVSKVQGPKSEKRLPQFAKESEMSISLNIDFKEATFEELRDHLMVELFYQTGMRLSELINLKKSNVQGSRLRVLGKRQKERIIPVSKSLIILIEKYLESSKEKGFMSEYLVVNNKGDKLYPKFVYRKINDYLGKVTDLKKCSPHVLRHTFATHMLNNGASLESIKELLGHANLSATQVYTHNSFAQLNNIYSLAHPRGRKTN